MQHTNNSTTELASGESSAALTKLTSTEIAKTINQFGVTDLLKPLVKEIELFDTYVCGVLEIETKILKALKVGDKLILRKGIDERFGDSEITIFTEKQVRIGYISEKDSLIFARLMSAGKLLTAKITELDFSEEIPCIKIKILLVDY